MFARTLVAAFALALVAVPQRAEAKAAYHDLDGATEAATAIALVRIESIENTATAGKHWVYGQRARGRTIEVFKGDLGETFELLADKDFVCAPADLEGVGTYLVFLRREGDAWTSVNHGLGQVYVIGDEVLWPYDDSRDLVPLATAIAAIRERTGTPPPVAVPPDAATPGDTAEHEAAAVQADDGIRGLAPSAWIAAGGAAVLLGFAVASTRRRRR